MNQMSLEAFWMLGDVKISHRQQQVLDALRALGSACNRQISAQSHLPINVVTPRTNELVRKGIVEHARIDVDITGKRVNYWRIRD